jgi:hypothetical protein
MTLYRVMTDGKVFRIQAYGFGRAEYFVCGYDGKALEFASKAEAEAYIHDKLSMAAWVQA